MCIFFLCCGIFIDHYWSANLLLVEGTIIIVSSGHCSPNPPPGFENFCIPKSIIRTVDTSSIQGLFLLPVSNLFLLKLKNGKWCLWFSFPLFMDARLGGGTYEPAPSFLPFQDRGTYFTLHPVPSFLPFVLDCLCGEKSVFKHGHGIFPLYQYN